jgi:hypothetical protein
MLYSAGGSRPSSPIGDEREGRLECKSLDAETLLAATLDIPTFSKAFATLKRQRE